MSTTSAFTWARRGLTGAFIGYGLVREQRRRRKAEHIPDKFVLELDFTRLAIGERPPTPREKLQEALGDEERRERLLLRDAVAAINDAAADPRVAGLSAQFGMAGELPLAQAQELHAAIRGFRAAKAEAPTVAWADEFVGRQYYLGSAFQDVYVQPGSQVSLPSLSTELPFLRGFLARWGIKFEAVKRSEFKNALDQFTEKSATPDQQKATYRLLRSLFEELSADVAAARGVSARQLRRLCARSTELTAAEATRARLLSGTRYADENADAVAKEAGTKAKLSLASYHRKIKNQKEKRAFRERVASAGAGPAALDEVAKALPALLGVGPDDQRVRVWGAWLAGATWGSLRVHAPMDLVDLSKAVLARASAGVCNVGRYHLTHPGHADFLESVGIEVSACGGLSTPEIEARFKSRIIQFWDKDGGVDVAAAIAEALDVHATVELP